MSEFNNMKILPPKSLMNLENAEKVWEIINKRYPKVAPLLCEMEFVLDQAEDLLGQLQLSGYPEKNNSSVDESSNVNMDHSSEIIENKNPQKNSEDQERNLTKDTQKLLDDRMINETSALASREILEDDGTETEESLAFLTNVVRTLKRNEGSKSKENREGNLKNNSKPSETSPETENQLKISETESSDSWSEVVGDSSESNESFFTENVINSEIARSEKKRMEDLSENNFNTEQNETLKKN